MPYTVVHRFADIRSKTSIHVENDLTWARFSASGPIDVAFTGRLEHWAYAAYFIRLDDDGAPSPDDSQLKTLRLTTTILTPDGEPFTGDEVTLADLRRFRDLRGVQQGPWSYSVAGESTPVPTEGGLRLVPSDTHITIKQHELVPSSSAPPLVDTTVSADQGASLPLDLFHVGRLEVVASPGVPSVTMLRMFARYAAEARTIAPFDQFEADVLAGDLPSFTVVDPAMHHKPQTDDHPVADMYRGQCFLDEVYRKLRANEAVWARTLLLITYDEHGGFYDHVVPPVAEILDDGTSAVVTPYGVRVPIFAVSPWVPAGLGPPVVLDHCSILKTVHPQRLVLPMQGSYARPHPLGNRP